MRNALEDASIGFARQARFQHCAERLKEVELWIALPGGRNIQFPVHSRQSRAKQAVIDAIVDVETRCVELFPFLEEGRIFAAAAFDRRARPVGRKPRRALYARNVIGGKRLVDRTPAPEVFSETLQSAGSAAAHRQAQA